MLQPSRLNPKLSAYAQLNVTFDYNRTPMPPPGTRNIVYDKQHNRGTWAPHRQEGLYVRPSMLHCRCLKSYIPKTALERVSDTTELFPAHKSFPSLSSSDAVTNATADLMEALHHPAPSSPIPNIGEKKTMALRNLAAIFNTDVTQ